MKGMLLLAAWLPPLETTGIAVAIAAIKGFLLFTQQQIFLSQEGCIYPYINVRPGQRLIQGALSMSIEGRDKLAFTESPKPLIIVESFRPGIKGAAKLPGTIDNLTQTPIPSGKSCLKQAGPGIMPRNLGTGAAQL